MSESQRTGAGGPMPQMHPLRDALYQELHARPFPVAKAPLRVTHLAMMTNGGDAERHREHISRLAARYNVNPPAAGSSCYYENFPGFECRWEQHTEFCTYTFLRPGISEHPFSESAIGMLPAGWVQQIPGQALVATHVAIADTDPPDPFGGELERLFEQHMVFGSRIVDGRATVWTAFHVHTDEYSRILVYNKDLNDFQTGRTLQRLLEIETYRIMTLLGLPEAKKIWPRVQQLDVELAEVVDALARSQTQADEKQLMQRLTAISQAIEHMRSDTNFRFSATRAYMDLVTRRLADLREQKFPGMSSMTKFLERRLSPAVRTCESADAHLQDLSRRVARATETLRARMETTIESQNQNLLESMNRRSMQQLRLQETVEGLSVAAISYYLIGLLRYGLKAMVEAGWSFDLDVVTGILVVPVVAAVYALVYWRRRRIIKKS